MIMKKMSMQHIVMSVLSLFLVLATVYPAAAVEFNENTAQSADPGQKASLDASQNESLKVAQEAMAIPQQPAPPAATIDDQVDRFLERAHLRRGWNKRKQAYIAVGESVVDCEDPSYDTAFITKRSLKSMEAVLDAKTQIIQNIRTEMSVMDRASTPGTDLNAQFREKIDKLQAKMESQRRTLVILLRDVDSKQADMLAGATFGDRLNELMDAAIKKLDENYSSTQIEEKKKAKFEKAKSRYQSAENEYKETEAKLNALTGAKTETLSSKVETMSAMPLMGGLVIAQFEAWEPEEEKFRTAIVMMWSKKMEAVVRSFISGEKMTVPPGKMSIDDYIKNNDWSSSTGGRRFRDNHGDVYFIGIGTAAVGSSSSSEKNARRISAMDAQKEVATAIFADVSSHQKAEKMMETYNGGTGKDTSVAAESFAEELSQSMKNRTINGLQRLYARKLKHPVSGQTIYVTIYGVSGQSAREALLMEESNYLTRIMDVKSQQISKGIKAGHQEAVKNAEADTTAYHQAKSATAAKQRANAQAQQSSPMGQSSAPAQGSSGAGGVYSGAGQDDASW